MKEGFFYPADLQVIKSPPTLVPRCGQCGLYRKCRSPKMSVHGRGYRKILIVGEGPGENEDKIGRPFIGNAGKFLRENLEKVGVDLDSDCWTTNSIICRAIDLDGRNRSPTDNEIKWCRPNIIREITERNPEIIILLGAPAVKSVLGWIWKEDAVKGISQWIGWQIPSQNPNVWVCPTWHPSYILRSDKSKPVLEKLFLQHLSQAVGCDGVPWSVPCDYHNRLRLVLDPDKAGEVVEGYQGRGKPVSFDFETNMLKPDHTDAEIVCSSISDGQTSISFPWYGRAVRAMKELLVSDIPKIGFNLKFEFRFCKSLLGIEVRNWIWDGMVGAHVLDNRSGICSLKFQSFVLLGMGDYSSHIKPYLESDGSNVANRVRELPITKLLEYCAMDSLLEWLVADNQMKRMGKVI